MRQFLVVGLGRFGRSIAETLYKHNETLLAMDKDEDLVQDAINNNILDNAIVVDATDSSTLKNLGIHNFDVAFVCIGTDIQASILIALTLKEIGVRKVIAKALTESHGKVLQKIGVDEIVYPETYMGKRMAMREIEPNMIEHIKFSDDHILLELKTPRSFVGKSLLELDLRKKFQINVIGVKNKDGNVLISPGPETKIDEGDTLVVITDNSTAKKLRELD